jgi:hypothetical protein
MLKTMSDVTLHLAKAIGETAKKRRARSPLKD